MIIEDQNHATDGNSCIYPWEIIHEKNKEEIKEIMRLHIIPLASNIKRTYKSNIPYQTYVSSW